MQAAVAHHETRRRGLAGAAAVGQISDGDAEVFDEGGHLGIVEIGGEGEDLGAAGLEEVDRTADDIVIIRMFWIDLDHRNPRRCRCERTERIDKVIVRE